MPVGQTFGWSLTKKRLKGPLKKSLDALKSAVYPAATMKIASVVVTPAMPFGLLKAVCRRRDVVIGDVVSGFDPLTDIADAIRGDSDKPTIGSLMRDALRFCVEQHHPDQLLFVVPNGQRDSLADYETVRDWIRDMCRTPRRIGYVIMRQAVQPFEVLRLACVDFRITRALESIEPAHTAWMRLPNVEGLLADTATQGVVMAEINRLMDAYGASGARVASDPHEDCLARQVRHRNGASNEEWPERDVRLMHAQHAAAHAVLQDSGWPCLNEGSHPVRAFRRQDTGEFALDTY